MLYHTLWHLSDTSAQKKGTTLTSKAKMVEKASSSISWLKSKTLTRKSETLKCKKLNLKLLIQLVKWQPCYKLKLLQAQLRKQLLLLKKSMTMLSSASSHLIQNNSQNTHNKPLKNTSSITLKRLVKSHLPWSIKHMS
jgi:hypothetical protein